MSMMVPDQRAPEQEGPDDRDQHAACDLDGLPSRLVGLGKVAISDERG